MVFLATKIFDENVYLKFQINKQKVFRPKNETTYVGNNAQIWMY